MFIDNLRSRLPHLLLLTKLAAPDPTSDEVPTELINQPTGGDASGPCSLCRVKTIKDAEGTSKGGSTLELYYDDEQGHLYANITLTYRLANGEYGHQVIEGVDLVAGGTSWYELRPEGSWDWARDVEYLWVAVTDARS